MELSPCTNLGHCTQVSITHYEHDNVEVVGQTAKVVALVLHDLERLLDDVEEEEADEDELAGEDEVVEGVDVPEQLDGVEGGEGRDAARRRELEEQLDDAEEVDVGVVDGEVDGDHPRALVDPEPLPQLLDDGEGLVLHRGHVLVVSPRRETGGAAAAQFGR